MAFKKQSPSSSELREQILTDVAEGRLSPPQAENMAAQMGLGRFEQMPDVASFQFLKLPVWSLETVVAWLIWRNESRAVRYYEPLRERWQTWHFAGTAKRVSPALNPLVLPPPVPTFRLGRIHPATLKDVERDALLEAPKEPSNSREKMVLGYTAAVKELIEHLIDNRLVAHGIRFDTNSPCEIPSHEWRYLSFQTAADMTVACIPPDPQPFYRMVTFDRVSVVALWPASISQGPPKQARVGRPPSFDKQKIMRLAMEMINDRGGWDPVNDPKFTHAEICRQLHELMDRNNWKRPPSDSTLKAYVSESVREYLRQQSVKNGCDP